MKRIPQFFTSETNSYLKYLTGLSYDAEPQTYRLSKIICTIGPACRSLELLEMLMAQGMNIARLNFSHGSHKYHAETLSMVRQAVKIYSAKMDFEYPLAIALDTKGPEIRTGLIDGRPTGEVELIDGEAIQLTPNDKYREHSTKDIVYVDYINILKLVKPGNRIFVDDGLISLVVEKLENDIVHCTIENGGKLGSSKGVNLPSIAVDLPAVSEKDKQDLQFGVAQNVDMVFASFIRNAKALDDIREVLGAKGSHIKVISKIENHQGMQNIDEIIDASDGIMVARGDLGIEIPAPKVLVAQKTIIARCNRAGKPVICATQMLESMTQKPRPTRAEVSDVGNAVLDGADCVMLSGETAKGSYPLNCIEIMSDTCREAENIIQYREQFTDLVNTSKEKCQVLPLAAVQAALKILAAAIVVITSTGETAFMLSKYRPHCPIIMITDRPENARLGSLYRGIFPFITECFGESETNGNDASGLIEKTLEKAKKQQIFGSLEPVVVLVPRQEESGFEERLFVRRT